ncbi:HYC_CC_PP family protein [Parafilimonas terrae]|uniref:Uncharacterized protein n=1 Tax=Parafilimonas terrae TaxID=1465490 RepID=A0A1I5RW49_9BACT|nr:hypothetical protein [Parafilimonas terrae]SFP62745.1 hypothetical protein SAMN05444277_101452 [Parafilimonas terrae]
MKRILSILLFVVYATASSGATISFHYCMGKFIGWDIDKSDSGNCDNCGMHKQEQQGCCNDAHASFNISKEQVSSVINFTPLNHTEYTKNYPLVFIDYPLFNSSIVFHRIEIPPPRANPPFLLNCVFRI